MKFNKILYNKQKNFPPANMAKAKVERNFENIKNIYF